MQRTQLDKYYRPVNPSAALPLAGTALAPIVPWKFSVIQGIQANNIRSGLGIFNNLQAGTSGTAAISMSTISTSLFKNGTVANNIVSGATVSSSSWTGGTLINTTVNASTLGTPALLGGTWNNGVIGTPAITGGTCNAALFKTNGSVGVSGTAIYVKTVDFVGSAVTLGTIISQNGIITSIN